MWKSVIHILVHVHQGLVAMVATIIHTARSLQVIQISMIAAVVM